ncbi:HlyD family secretion protein [Rugamonas sp. CCM 8940]|uniref:HlyD family secretion protein n=1 Tax=Rugamonas sp. CCM 8940 TaxID=2765359 RepID=UPI0018F53EC2|nr:HlyD family efflux transporter periplasmic adaptor subunit [Rugamonas sp. CCM 8940]MBJ7313624.1 HlyD family efflux transporter periplasmic adaptor subunit [Rugamonas sp. CCM 8940]
MSRSSLFRAAAVNANRIKWLGDVVLIRPISFAVLTAVAVAFILIIGGFFLLGSYTKRSSVSGQLAPDIGVIKVYTPQPGIVIQKRVSEGQEVRQGDLLFIVSSERKTAGQGEIQASISRQVSLRQQSLRAELQQTKKVLQEDEFALRKRIDGLQAEHANIVVQLAVQQSRVDLAEEAIKRSSQLQSQGFISKEMMQQKQADLLDQRSRQQALARDQITVARELLAQQTEQTSLPFRQQSRLAQIARQLASLDQEWTESEAKRRIVVTAPESGVATAVAVDGGQTVDGAKSLVSIVPRGALLQAHLYAPSRAIGFIRPNDRVLLRYQAYPYQKFGQAEGIVISISRATLSGNELNGIPTTVNGSIEPLYRITVKLARQTLMAYGRQQTLQAGMLVDADILQERRRLYEWVLDPLYSLTGKF